MGIIYSACPSNIEYILSCIEIELIFNNLQLYIFWKNLLS